MKWTVAQDQCITQQCLVTVLHKMRQNLTEGHRLIHYLETLWQWQKLLEVIKQPALLLPLQRCEFSFYEMVSPSIPSSWMEKPNQETGEGDENTKISQNMSTTVVTWILQRKIKDAVICISYKFHFLHWCIYSTSQHSPCMSQKMTRALMLFK